MRILGHVVSLTLAWSTITLGCVSAPGTESEENIDRQAQALPMDPIDPGEPTPVCIANCTGQACGAADGCGKTCKAGSCPTGTVCGGGGTPNVCACKPNCTNQVCGAPDGCGGTCTAGSCAAGLGCGLGGDPNSCAPIPLGQGVECFVFNDGTTDIRGPSTAIYFSPEGKACIPDGTSGGTCRRWFGRCRTTDSSHTPVSFRVGTVPVLEDRVIWSAPADAVASQHYRPDIFSAESSLVCIPDGTPHGICGRYFGNATMEGGRPVRCRLFDDGEVLMTGLTGRMADVPDSLVWAEGVAGAVRKWFGLCQAGGCGDGVCDISETHASCPADCTCGDGICNNGESRRSCAADCTCGDGTCNNGETAASCAADCGPRCGDGVCNKGETCSSCAGDCGPCKPPTCSGDVAGPTASIFVLGYEDANSCAGVVSKFANSRSEAVACVESLGVEVVSQTVVTKRFFHIDSRNGCSALEVPSFSDESAARCARAQGYALRGPCP
jgi:hypothetical protein